MEGTNTIFQSTTNVGCHAPKLWLACAPDAQPQDHMGPRFEPLREPDFLFQMSKPSKPSPVNQPTSHVSHEGAILTFRLPRLSPHILHNANLVLVCRID
ncbi:hypothetical protein VNO77_03762 [Canavalia gladiata]|uniref:Uncharacterized protein n=1 Tax=Canavalia gladiata TaxID=3824 RepID=A0AAN9N1R3_CANGL